jgi:hypothetical protein
VFCIYDDLFSCYMTIFFCGNTTAFIHFITNLTFTGSITEYSVNRRLFNEKLVMVLDN